MILPEKYLASATENKWRKYWHDHKIYQWQNDSSKQQTFVIDTPPPTVSGLLHMGHIFSYTQADFVARFNRSQGKDVFYPMGFDDNGLPTERLVEKIIGKKAGIYENENGRGSFVAKCREVVVEAEQEFEQLFREIALSVDWEQKYQTISPESQKISQASFVDLFNKGLVEKQNQPVFWDISDRTALAQADIIDKEIEGEMFFINFAIDGQNSPLEIMTTRPELLPACVAVMINGQDDRYQNLILQSLNPEGEGETGSFAISPIFGVKVPIIADNSVQLDKGTGVVMCCTFGDETDVEWWQKYELPLREIINHEGSIKNLINVEDQNSDFKNTFADYVIMDEKSALFLIEKNLVLDPKIFIKNYQKIANQKIKEAKKIIVELLSNLELTPHQNREAILTPPQGGSFSPSSNLNSNSQNQTPVLIKSQKIIRSVKCAERSGVPIELLVRPQWYIKIKDKKDKLIEKSRECNWYPEYMRVRIEQWIDGLSRDWCISRQRFFGVKFPIWYSKRKGEEGKILVASLDQLPCDPMVDLPKGYLRDEVSPETDIMDTWATSSISPQLSSKGISDETYFDEKSQERHKKLFPADMRPQAHEIIRTWAFYTIVKAYLHSLNRIKTADGTFAKNPDGSPKLEESVNSQNSIPWQNLMISGWCLAADKTKMSKSKGNVITPTALIQEKSADVVRYWASASSLGADIAYSEEVFKIGQKLITKLFNSAKFCSQHFTVLQDYFEKNPAIKNNDEALLNLVSHPTDLWILNQLEQVINNYVSQFQQFEYAKAREILEEFFWKNFCDNYLEICKVRSYGLSAEKLAGLDLTALNKQQILSNQLSAIATLSLSLKNILKLFAPFVPHLTEELYSIIFASEFEQFKSIHARHNCAKISLKNHHLISQINTAKIGENLLEIIFVVRKFKSEKNLSMKATISLIELPKSFDITGIEDDILNVCNAQKIVLKNDLSAINIIE